MNDRRGTSPWLWFACGCIALTFVTALVIVGGFLFVGREVQELADDMEDPDRRRDRALEVLGADALPEGYYAMGGFAIPFVFEIARLTDRPPAADRESEERGFDERGFIYIGMLAMGRQQDELRDFFEGRTDDPEILRDNNIHIRQGERVANGELERDDAEILWRAARGRVSAFGADSDDGLTNLILIDCPHDRRMRLGIWFGPAPRSGTGAEAESGEDAGGDLDLAGTVADPEEVATFMAHFRPCA